MIWLFASVGAAVVLLMRWQGPNAVWGTATFGALLGIAIAVLQPGFDWTIVGKAFVAGTFVGLALEWLPQIGRSKAKPSFLRVRWLALPPTDPIETWSELDAFRKEVRSVQIWADGRVGYASREEEVGGARLSSGTAPTLKAIVDSGWAEPEVISASEFERRWQQAVAHPQEASSLRDNLE